MEHINIYSGKKAISRIVTSDSIKGLGACLEPFRSVFAVIDKNIPVNAQLMEMLKAKGARIRYISPSEETKTFETVMDICGWLLENGADRDAMILAVGGGITTDMAGFAACIYKRGVRFAYVPTTLLSQVDAAIGGKTGVNFEKYKNILGIIRQPAFTYICPQLLESLPKRDFLSGAAEMLKTFIIENDGSYEKAVDWLSGYVASEEPASYLIENSDELAALIASAVLVKAGIVTRDQFEGGERRKLNLGHTIGHAVEANSAFSVSHGQAVAIGMSIVSKAACNGFCDLKVHLDITDILKKFGLPVSTQFDADALYETALSDKKRTGGTVNLILPVQIGSCIIHKIPTDQLKAFIESGL